MQTLPWIVAFAVSTLLAASLAVWAWHLRDRRGADALPTEWPLAPRPVFTADERRLFRSLREALPHHVVLSKLPLVRFCQPTDPGAFRYWHDLFGNSHVGFAICSANGRVLAAIDLDSDPEDSRRSAQVKQAALSACRIRYLLCPADQPPSIAELQLLVPGPGGRSFAPQPAPQAPSLTSTPPRPPAVPIPRRPSRPVLWQDTAVFKDSFFPTDNGLDDDDTDDGFESPANARSTDARRLTARGVGGRRRGVAAPVDFEPTRQGLEDDEDDIGGGLGLADDATPRFRPGSRRT